MLHGMKDELRADCSAFEAAILTTEAARILRVSAETVRSWERRGRLRATRIGRNGPRLFDRLEIESLARARADITTAA